MSAQTDTEPRCDKCRFFACETHQANGECRVSAPSRNSPRDGVMNATWPVVMPTQWCGRFDRRPSPRVNTTPSGLATANSDKRST